MAKTFINPILTRSYMILFLVLTIFITPFPSFGQNPAPITLSCIHSQVCNVLQEMFPTTDKSETFSSTPLSSTIPEILPILTVKGDPHHFDPSPADIKTMIKANYLLAPPLELWPWIQNIVRQRMAHSDGKQQTFYPSLPASLLKKYQIRSLSEKAALAHFWLYPEFLCHYKHELHAQLKEWGLSPLSPVCDPQLENDLAELGKIYRDKARIILTHEALGPLLEHYQFSFLALKGAGHHEEMTSAGLKRIHSLLKENKNKIRPTGSSQETFWIVEINHQGANWAKKLKRSQDHLVELDTEGRFPTTSESVLKNFIQSMKEGAKAMGLLPVPPLSPPLKDNIGNNN